MSRNLVVVTQTWKSLIESLKCNSLHGYKKLDAVSYDGVFYKAVLQQSKDTAYLEALQQLTGEEKDDNPSKDSFLGVERRTEDSESVKPIVIRPTPSGNEIKELFEQFVEPIPQELLDRMGEIIKKGEENKAKDALQAEAVGLKIKRTPRKPKESK